MISRRAFFGVAAAGAGAPMMIVGSARAQGSPGTVARRDGKLAQLARETRRAINFDGQTFSGPGLDWLLAQGRGADFFLLGEEHGIAENPKLAAQLFRSLVPAGYSKVAVEVSPPMAEELDRVVTQGGLPGLRRFLEDPGSKTAFFTMREEAEWLAAARLAVPGGKPFLWGSDYEFGGDRHLIRMLGPRRKPAAAERALWQLRAASEQAWTRFQGSRDVRDLPSISVNPVLVRVLRAAWTNRDAQSARILDTLEETIEINQLFLAGRGWESNKRRAALLRANFLHDWRKERKAKRSPRVFLKFGASHLMRGRSSTEVYDLGALVPELAEIEGKRAFSLLVLPGPGTQIAAYNPTQFTYARRNADESFYMKGLLPLMQQLEPKGFTLFETEPLRRVVSSSSDLSLLRMVHGFDAILVMSGSTAGTDL